jgi:hypothetical protein
MRFVSVFVPENATAGDTLLSVRALFETGGPVR